MIKKSHLHALSPKQKQFSFNTLEQEYTTESIEKDGLIIKRQVIKEVDRAKAFADFHSNDFTLDKQLAIGSFANRPITLDSQNIDAVVDSANKLEKFIDAIPSANSETD